VNLIPFAKQHLRMNETLPFGVRDAHGRLLLASGTMIQTEQRLNELLNNELYADEQESLLWRRRMLATVDSMFR